MLQSVRNKQTLELLKRLRRGGAPAKSVIEDVNLVGTSEEEIPDQPLPNGEVQDLSIPGMSIPQLRKKKRRSLSEQP